MSESTSSRPSGLPRPLSRLPVSRPTSSIPKPATTSSKAASLRSTQSRENLRARATPTVDTDKPLPRLRSSISYSNIRSSVQSPSTTNATGTPRLRATPSREQLHGNVMRAPAARPKAQPPVSMPRHARAPSTPRRLSSASSDHRPVLEPEASASQSTSPSEDQVLFKRRLTLTRRPSETFTAPLLSEKEASPTAADTDASIAPASEELDSNTSLPRTLRHRPSLAERTVETLAQVPSSPALRKKSSAFFDQTPTRPRTSTSTSRPGTSHNSDGSRASSRLGSRPGSSSGQDDSSQSGLISAAAFRSSLTPINGTPTTRTGLHGARTPRAGVNSVRKPQSVAATSSIDSPTSSPSTKKSYGTLGSTPVLRTSTTRSHQPKASSSDLFKKPSLPALKRPAGESAASRQASIDSALSSANSWDGTIPSIASTSSTTAESPEPIAPATRKSSTALRDQIAKAKAAKRAASRRISAQEAPSESFEESVVPNDDGFDFGVSHGDPFNTRKGQDPGQRVLDQRISAARASGRLNIAALNLKKIPTEVKKMYDLSSVAANGGNWAESVDLTRLVAADNELESLDEEFFPDCDPDSFAEDDDGDGNIFGGLEMLDVHGNLLDIVPLGFRRLVNLTSLNLSSNRLSNDCLDIISQMTALRDLKMAKNLFYGPLSPKLAQLDSLEILDVQGNNISSLPDEVGSMKRLRILNLQENSFESVPFDSLAKLPLTELNLKKNKLRGTLIEEPIGSLPLIQSLDVSINQLTRLVPLGSSIEFPMLHALSLSMNRLQGLPDMTSWTSLLTLTVEENSISSIPNSFMSLEKLRHADFSSNDIRVVPPEVSRMENLSMLRLSGNPLRDKKFASITTDELRVILASRLEPPPPYQDPLHQRNRSLAAAAAVDQKSESRALVDPRDEDNRSDLDDNFATPPTSAPQSPARGRSQTISSMRSRSVTASSHTWPVRSGGLLDRSATESSSLHPVVCSKVASEHRVAQAQLHHNLFSSFPNSLSFFADTLRILSLAHNQLVGESYLEELLELPALRELNVSSNRITSLMPLTRYLHSPLLEKIDVSVNRISVLPTDLKEAFPELKILMASNNQLIELEPETIQGLGIVEAANNDITFLNPRIGLLGGEGGLQRLDVMGNRFRVPRFNVMERGTESTLRWLRGRVPVAEMAAWKGTVDEDMLGGEE